MKRWKPLAKIRGYEECLFAICSTCCIRKPVKQPGSRASHIQIRSGSIVNRSCHERNDKTLAYDLHHEASTNVTVDSEKAARTKLPRSSLQWLFNRRTFRANESYSKARVSKRDSLGSIPPSYFLRLVHHRIERREAGRLADLLGKLFEAWRLPLPVRKSNISGFFCHVAPTVGLPLAKDARGHCRVWLPGALPCPDFYRKTIISRS